MTKYYIQDTRQIVGNCVLWWAKESKGYTCDIDDAGLYDEDEARSIANSRGTDVAWPQELVEQHIIRHVRAEWMHDEKEHRLK